MKLGGPSAAAVAGGLLMSESDAMFNTVAGVGSQNDPDGSGLV